MPKQTPGDVMTFANSFRSDQQLIDAVAELLRRMGRERVQPIPGAAEQGKNLVFYARGAFQERQLYACVIKNARLTGSTTSDKITRGVFEQVKLAFDAPSFAENGDVEPVQAVYVITPHQCDQSAMSAISSRLRSRSGRISFLCGSALLDLFVKHWPDFVLFDSGTLTAYLSGLPNSISTDGAFLNLVRRYTLLSDTVKPLTQIYVQRDFRQVLLRYTVCDATLPSINLDKPILFSTVRDIVSDLINLSNQVTALLRHANLSTSIRECILDFAREFEHQWILDFEGHRRRIIDDREAYQRKREETHFNRHGTKIKQPKLAPITEQQFAHLGLEMPMRDSAEMRLTSAANLQRTYAALRDKFNDSLRPIAHLVVAANHWTDSTDETANIPQAYLAVERLAAAAPQLISSEPTHRARSYPSQFLESGSSVLITGPAGFGKTSFCKWHTLRDASAFLEGKSEILPIYVPLHQLTPIENTGFEDVFIQRDDLKRALIDMNESASAKRNVRLYLDGLDEIPESKRQQSLMNLARETAASRENIQVIVTAREHVNGSWLSWLPRLRISDLSAEQIRDLVSKWLDQDEAKINLFIDQIENLPSLKQLMAVPLLGTLIIAVFNRTATVPSSKLHLYSLFVDLHCGGWDLVKNVRRVSRFGSHDKQLVLSRFAAKLHYDKHRDGHPAAFQDCVKEALPAFVPHWGELLTEILEDGLLTRAGAQLVFSHLSFQEYLTARYVAAEPEGHRATTILRLFLRGDEWWREVLCFYVGMYSHPLETVQWLRKYREQITLAGIAQRNVELRYKQLVHAVKSVYPAFAEDLDRATRKSERSCPN